MSVTLEKRTAFGFQIQGSKGSEISTDVLWVPFNDNLDFKLRTNPTDYRQADYNDYLHLMYSSGVWAEGGIPMSCNPDATVITSLLSWIQTRDTYNQGKWASVFLYDPVRGTRAFMDVKVREAVFRFTKGEPVRLDLQLVGLSDGADSPTVVMDNREGPFLWWETAVTYDYGGAGSLSSTVDIEAAEVRIDNMLHDPADGLRITDTSIHPQQLYNIGDIDCSGSFSRDFLDSNVYTAWINQASAPFITTYDGGIQFILTRGGASITILVNRFQYTDHDAPYAGSNEGRVVEAAEWRGLGSDDGATAPITLS